MASGDARKARKAARKAASKAAGKAPPRSPKQKILLVVLVLAVFLGAVGLHFYLYKYPKLLRARMEAYESAAVAACKTYCEAQDIFRRTDWDDDGALEYAASIDVSGANSLAGKDSGFGGPLIDADYAAAVGDPGTAHPRAGYVFKMLTKQGAAAPGGAKSYVDADGNMTQGYALIACPADYDKTGRNTFVVNMSGVVYQKDLGPDTVKLYLSTDAYDPDETWTVAE